MIPYNKVEFPNDKETLEEIQKILSSGWTSIGKWTEEFEETIRQRFGVEHAIATNNATQGLIIAIKAAGWKKRKIAVPAFTWPSTVYAIECNDNVSVFGDIHSDSWDLNLSSIGDNYDYVISVDTFGEDSSYGLDKATVIYDAAHSFFTPNLGHRGLAEVVSLSFTKLLSAMEGGIILTNDDDLAETAIELRRLSARMLEINALIGLKNLYNLTNNMNKRDDIIKYYRKNLDFDFTEQQRDNLDPIHSTFAILLPETYIRDEIALALTKANIEYKIYYTPMVEGLTNTDYVYSHIICLPSYALLTEEQVKTICEVVNTAANKKHPGINYLKNSGYLDNYLRKQM